MNVFSRIAIGTANWGEPYGHRKVQCPRDEQGKIIDYCAEHGIDTIHTKDAYGADLSWLPPLFEIIDGEQDGFSVYDLGVPIDLTRGPVRREFINVPYSIVDRRFEAVMEHGHIIVGGTIRVPVHVRSIFCQGKVFTGGEPVFEAVRTTAHALNMTTAQFCLQFVLLNPHVDKIVVGVDSLQQLQEMLLPYEMMDRLRCDEPSLIDPRTF